jgi:CubicO group peptidase (beta-lactamase class C family)
MSRTLVKKKGLICLKLFSIFLSIYSKGKISTNQNLPEGAVIKMRKIFLFAFFAALAAVAPPCLDSAEIVKGELGAKFDQYLTRITPFGFSGALLVAKGNDIILNKGYGLAVRSEGIPNTAETVFCVGSITKQFTAAAIMTLEMQGKLNTADPISKYLDGVPEDKSGITVHHLLTHSSGLIQDVGGDYQEALRDETVRKILAQPLEFKPGERFAYTNVGYSLLAAIVEKVSGQPYETYLYEHLFKPAGMEWTGYRRPDWKRRVVAHWYVGEKDNNNSLSRPFPYWNLLGNGGILSTTEDMYKWHRALLGEKILSAEAKKKIFTPYLNDYGYGWDVLKRECGLLIQHNGGSDLGNNAEIRRYIDADIVTILFCNQFDKGRPLFDVIRDKIENLAFGKEVAFPPAVKESDQETLNLFEGVYVLPTGGSFKVEARNKKLLIKPEGQEAVNTLLLPEAADVSYYARISELSAKIFDAAVKGDFNPFGAAMANKERRFERVKELVEKRIKMSQEEIGAVQKVKAWETLPSFFEEGAVETTVELQGERGSIFFQLIWSSEKNIGLRALDFWEPLYITFLPVSRTEFAGYDLALARNMRVNFILDKNGMARSLIIHGPEKKVKASKVTSSE